MKITKQLLKEMIEEEVKGILNEGSGERFLSMSRNDIRRAQREIKGKPGMANIVSNMDRAILMLITISDMLSNPTDYNQEHAQNLGLLPPNNK